MMARWVLVGLAVIVSVWLYYPGYMSYDAIDQLTQAREGVFRDWHPPLMAYLWGGLDRILPGPGLMLVWQNLMFWGGLGLVAARLRGWRGIALILGVGLLPPILATVGTIWKDSMLASALLLATGLLSWGDSRQRVGVASLALLPLFYALALRHNAAPAVLPLFLWWGWQVVRLWDQPPRQRAVWAVGVGLGTAAVLLVAVTLLNNRLTSYPTYPFQQIWAHDVVAVSLARGEVLLPPELNDPPFTIAQLRAIYTPDTVVPLFCCTPEPRRIEQVRYLSRGYKVDALFAQWRTVIPQNLSAYIAHRGTTLAAMAGWGRAAVCFPFESRVEPNALGVEFHPPPLNRWLTEQVFTPLQESLWFRVWLYWGINSLLVVGIVLWKPLRQPPMMALLFSGALYMLPYLVATTACDFRFSWWMIVATVTAGGLYLLGSFTDRPTESGKQKAETATSAEN
jgi:hypothetical protein